MKHNSLPFISNGVNSYVHNSEIVLPKQDFVKDDDVCPIKLGTLPSNPQQRLLCMKECTKCDKKIGVDFL